MSEIDRHDRARELDDDDRPEGFSLSITGELAEGVYIDASGRALGEAPIVDLTVELGTADIEIPLPAEEAQALIATLREARAEAIRTVAENREGRQ